MSEPLRAMMIGAHPDDVDICTCGITKRLVSKGCIVRFVSMTTGNAGHQTMRGEELIKTRAAEAQKSAAYLGATYEILPFDDGRACDYHPDHRATGQLVQDCSYLMGVPAICPDTPVLRKTPTILYWADGFTDPKPFRSDFARPADDDRETLFHVESCHASQFLDWLPWADDHVDLAGKTHEERVEYLRSTFNWDRGDVDEDVLACLTRQYGAEFAKTVRFAESWQVSEYGAPVSDALKELLIGLD